MSGGTRSTVADTVGGPCLTRHALDAASRQKRARSTRRSSQFGACLIVAARVAEGKMAVFALKCRGGVALGGRGRGKGRKARGHRSDVFKDASAVAVFALQNRS